MSPALCHPEHSEGSNLVAMKEALHKRDLKHLKSLQQD